PALVAGHTADPSEVRPAALLLDEATHVARRAARTGPGDGRELLLIHRTTPTVNRDRGPATIPPPEPPGTARPVGPGPRTVRERRLQSADPAIWVHALLQELWDPMPPGAPLGLELAAAETVLELQYLRVSLLCRGQGHAARVLTRLCAEADARDLTVVCTPTSRFGADRARLQRFLRRHGFTTVPAASRLTGHIWERPTPSRRATVRTAVREEQETS
ncbi:hypothetical protein, partial [Streptomyces clavuligerus]